MVMFVFVAIAFLNTDFVAPPPPNRQKVNRPTAGARTVKQLQTGEHPIQLYSLATPNGQKITVALEEMGLKYDAWHTDIMAVSSICRPWVTTGKHIPGIEYATIYTRLGRSVFLAGLLLAR